jgi:hypothetical protein
MLGKFRTQVMLFLEYKTLRCVSKSAEHFRPTLSAAPAAELKGCTVLARSAASAASG